MSNLHNVSFGCSGAFLMSFTGQNKIKILNEVKIDPNFTSISLLILLIFKAAKNTFDILFFPYIPDVLKLLGLQFFSVGFCVRKPSEKDQNFLKPTNRLYNC